MSFPFVILLSAVLCLGGCGATSDEPQEVNIDDLEIPEGGKADSILNPTEKGELRLYATRFDHLSLGSGFHIWEFSGQAGMTVDFTLNQAEGSFIPYLRVYSPSGIKMSDRPDMNELTTAKESSGELFADFAWELPETGTYKVLVTSVGNMLRLGGVAGALSEGSYALVAEFASGKQPSCTTKEDCFEEYLTCGGDGRCTYQSCRFAGETCPAEWECGNPDGADLFWKICYPPDFYYLYYPSES